MKQNNLEPSTNKVVAYIRKSSEDRDDGVANKQLNSLQYQHDFVEKTIKDNGYTLVHSPFEDDKSGYDAYSRPNFMEMMEFIKSNSGKIDAIICTEISRLARNFGDGGQILWYLQSGEIKRIITHGKIFTNSSADQLMVAIEFALSKKSSDDTGYRTIEGQKTKVLVTRNPPMRGVLGYLSVGRTGAKVWIIDPEIAPKIKELFEVFASGKVNLQEISNYAESIGLRSSDSKSRSSKYSKNTWRNRLRDIKYTGVFDYHGERYVGEYEPIISSELFYKVQSILDGNSHPKKSHMEYAYTGLITCGLCGSPMSATHKKANTYYRCSKRLSPCKNSVEDVPYINEKKLEEVLFTSFKKIEIDDEMWKEAKEYVTEINKPQKAELNRRVVLLEGQLAHEDKQQLNFGLKFSSGDIEKRDYDRLMEDSKAKQESIRRTILTVENLKTEIDQLMNGLLDNLKFITTRLETAKPENRRAIVEVFCENLTWNNEKVLWSWKNPFYILADRETGSTLLPVWDFIRTLS